MVKVGVNNWVADNTAGARRSLVESVLQDEGLGSRVLSHSLTTNDKKRIAAAYEACFNTQFRKTCSNCHADAFFTIRNKNLTEIMDKCKYSLKNGAVIELDNKPYTNKNLTNEVAEAFMAKFPTNRFFVIAPEVKTKAPEAPAAPKPLTGAAKAAADKKAKKEAAEKAKADAEAAETTEGDSITLE